MPHTSSLELVTQRARALEALRASRADWRHLRALRRKARKLGALRDVVRDIRRAGRRCRDAMSCQIVSEILLEERHNGNEAFVLGTWNAFVRSLGLDPALYPWEDS